jgi:hypothetical protein
MECRNDPHPHEKSSLMGGASRSDHVWFPPDTSNRAAIKRKLTLLNVI